MAPQNGNPAAVEARGAPEIDQLSGTVDWERSLKAQSKQVLDPRLVFLHRAGARAILVDAGLMLLDEAYDDLVAGLPCACTLGLVDEWERRLRPGRRA
jgi:hypothetical protein